MPKSIFTVAGHDGGQYEVLAECTDPVDRIVERASFHYRKPMRDIVAERRLTRAEEYNAMSRLGWGVRVSKRVKKIEDL